MTTVNVIRGLNGSPMPEQIHADSVGQIAWTNTDLVNLAGPQDDPIGVLLKLLISTGFATNYASGTTNYWDKYEPGIGLAIPYDQIDIQSFLDLQALDDWDANQQLYFQITEPQPAKEFIDEEICRPFGLYLTSSNTGLLRLVRPRHPQKFYIGATNRTLALRCPGILAVSPGPVVTVELPIGVFSGPELAALVASSITTAITAANYNQTIAFTCTYNTSTWKFTLQSPIVFDLQQDSLKAWKTLGWTVTFGGANTYNTLSSTSDTPRGRFTGLVLTQNDMWGVRQIENGDDRITRVAYWCDYNVDKDHYRTFRPYVNVESANLGEAVGTHDYVIRSKGLISAGPRSPAWCRGFSSPSPGQCNPKLFGPSPNTGVDADTWSMLYAHHLLDRYKQPPIKFRARLKWSWNTLEVGDVVQVSYTIPGVFVDHEVGATTLNNRLFEIVELHPNFDGSLEATFLGHRYVGY